MLQSPTNIYPDGSTFDPSVQDENDRISFIFNGDFFTGALYKVYNYDTGEEITIPNNVIGYQDHHAFYYNGDTVSTFSPPDPHDLKFPFSTLSAGNYVMQIQLFQYNASGAAPLYDMFILRGIVQKNYLTTDDHIDIEDNISNIYEWDDNAYDGKRRPSLIWSVVAGSMVIRIGSEQREIIYYDPVTGSVGLSSPFSANIAAGTKYQIYSNYVVSQQYYFKCRSTPTATLTLAILNDDPTLHHRVTGTYSQAQNSLINYYSIALYYSTSDSSNSVWTKVDETGRIYSQQIKYDFWDDFVLRHATTYGFYYKAVATIVTNDGMTITQESNVVDCRGIQGVDAPTSTTSLIVEDLDRADVNWESKWSKQTIRIVPTYSGDFPQSYGTVRTFCYREDLQTGETRMVNELWDVTVPTKGKFRYYIIPKNSDGRPILKAISYADINVNMKGYTITELKLMDNEYQWGSRVRYKVGDSWKFVGDVQNSTITQNVDRAIHVGYGTYPIQTMTNTNYMSGTVSAMLGYVDCKTSYGTKDYEDNVNLVRAWRDFITRPSIFMLKSQKGDVWIVNTTDNPTVTYDETIKELPTTISFNWVECCSVDDIIILAEHQD